MPSIIDTYGPFVKDQIAYADKQAGRFLARGEDVKAKACQGRSAVFKQLLVDLEDVASAQPKKTAGAPDPFRLSSSDLEGLPEELIAELSLNESDKREFFLIELIDKAGGIASLDRILVDQYRATGEIEKRSKLVSRLYRMVTKGLIYTPPDRKGVYSTAPIDPRSESRLGIPESPESEGGDAQDLI